MRFFFYIFSNWTDYADIEYSRIISEENYVNSLDEQEDSLCREEYEEAQEYEENDEISHSSDDGLSDSLSVTSSNSFRSEIQTPDLHDPDCINSTVPESSEPEQQDTEDESCCHPTSYNSKTKYYENTQEHTILDCLHQHITN